MSKGNILDMTREINASADALAEKTRSTQRRLQDHVQIIRRIEEKQQDKRRQELAAEREARALEEAAKAASVQVEKAPPVEVAIQPPVQQQKEEPKPQPVAPVQERPLAAEAVAAAEPVAEAPKRPVQAERPAVAERPAAVETAAKPESAPTPVRPVQGARPAVQAPIRPTQDNRPAAPAAQRAPMQGGAPRPAGDRPFNRGPRPAGDRPFNNAPRPAGDRPFNNAPRPAGDRPYGNAPRPAGDRPYGNAPRPAGDRPYGNAPRPAGDRPYGNAPRPAGDRPYGNAPRPAGDRPYGNAPRPAGDRPYGNAPRPAGDRPYGNAPRQAGDRPYGNAPRPAGGGAPRRPAAGAGVAVPALPVMEKGRVSNYDPNKKIYERNRSASDRKIHNVRKSSDPTLMGDDFRGPRKARRNKPIVKQHIEPIKIEAASVATEMVSVKDLAERIGKPASEIIKKLLLLGIMATINQEIDFDTAQLVSSEFGVELTYKPDKTFEDTLEDEDREDKPEELITRPPVVTIMGHVDHGKTSLLDAIRRTRVTSSEAGGITQHIGAYMVERNKREITFVDTPGHEAFTSMRARGAKVTDIAIIVVAADDGVMPQTVEAINHVKAADVPIIVAINKIDKPAANVEKIKQELTEHGLVAEEWGGETVIVPVSAKTSEGIDELLEMILLIADVQDFKANPNRLAKGAIVEAQLDRGRGPVATVLVQNGTLRVGDTVVAGMAYGRVRAMMDDQGNRVAEAGPSHPVEVIGFSVVPDAGDTLYAVEDDKLSRQVVQERRDKIKIQQVKAMSKVSLDDLFNQIAEGQVKELGIIVKADVQGSVEAVKQSLEKLSNEEVRVRCIHGGVGAISETDVMLASASNAIVIGFNVRADSKVREAAENEKIDIRLYRVIYNAIEDVEKAMKGMLAPVIKETTLGSATVRQVFKVTGVGVIAGSYVTEGKILRRAQVRVLRDGVVVHEGKIDSLKRFKDDAREVAQGYECGIGVENFNDIKEGDVLEAFLMEEVQPE